MQFTPKTCKHVHFVKLKLDTDVIKTFLYGFRWSILRIKIVFNNKQVENMPLKEIMLLQIDMNIYIPLTGRHILCYGWSECWELNKNSLSISQTYIRFLHDSRLLYESYFNLDYRWHDTIAFYLYPMSIVLCLLKEMDYSIYREGDSVFQMKYYQLLFDML